MAANDVHKRQTVEPSIKVGIRVALKPTLYEWKQGYREGIVTRVCGIFAEVQLMKPTEPYNLWNKRFHMVNLLPVND